MKRIDSLFIAACLASAQVLAQTPVDGSILDESLMTVPERTAYARTSTHAEVLETIDNLVRGSDLVHRETMLVTRDGRELPLLIVADPPVSTPEQAGRGGKPVIYIQGNIHGGEVEGKEAILILLRDILHGDKGHLLDNQIIALAPIYNADGNDQMSENSRPNQELSPVMTGQRFSHGYDLNRDGVAVETPETQGLYRNVLQRWDPQLFVDMHTTNGTWHGYSLTYAPSYHSAGDPATTDYTMNVMLPAVRQAVKEKFDLDFFLFGDFSLEQWPPTEFRTFHHAPRYLTNMMGLRNRMAILSETFSHDRFYKRIHSANVFIEEILEYTNEHGAIIQRINREADARTEEKIAEQGGQLTNGVAFEMVPLPEPITLRSYDHIPYRTASGGIEYTRSAELIDIEGVSNFQQFRPIRSAIMPKTYLFPAELAHIAEKLAHHGIEVERISANLTVEAQAFSIAGMDAQNFEQNGHRNTRLTGEYLEMERTFQPGDYRVSMESPLANLIFYLLEPEADDGLAYWNYFDDYLADAQSSGRPLIYPVFKVMD
ncbi:MAG: M14 family metallopeptidase [Gammaproteobacteria bacterium]|nr:M14 family metallopeptidase [Gammaproteobacteria bacterium]